MAGMIYDLIEQLGNENKIYKKLIETASIKRTQIIKGDIPKINEVNKKEEEIVVVLKGLERSRRELMNDIAMILNLNAETITITEIEEAMKNQLEEAESLGKIRDELKRSLQELKIVNDENMLLIDNSLDYTRFSINVLQSTMGGQPMTANYGDSTEKRNDSFFDTRQ